ncbi:MAG: O-antigen ligase protein [Marmoricola sp.]|nr:O-antigen ligase protein [Marmoricola sp.]
MTSAALTGAPTAERRPRPALGARSTPLTLAVALTVVLTPALVPPGPGNTAFADPFMAASIILAAVALSGTRRVVRLPYSSAVTLLVCGGLTGAIVAGAPAHVVLVIAQDVLLLLWCAVVALGREDVRLVEVVTRAWCRTAPALASIGVLAYLVGFAPLSGVTDADASRASYTFGDPNLAGSYLVLSLLIMFACQRPVRRRVRWASYAVVLTALVMTGSNGGMLSLMLTVSGLAILTTLRRQGPTAALVTLSLCGAATVGAAVYVAPRVDLTSVRIAAAESVPLVRDSVGRSDGSVSERAALLNEGTRLWLSSPGTGYGPARTKATLLAFQAPYVKEAHNDYLATLLERGPVGVIGLLLLGLTTGTYLRRLLVTPLRGAWHRAVPQAWALVVGAPVIAVSAAFYETLHFRHLWTWLGLVAALALSQGRRQDREEGLS